MSAIPSSALVFGVFKLFGQKWIERLLGRDLEQYKREQQEKLEPHKGEQQRELERLRHLLSTRISKIHEKEFEILPKAWLMLNELDGSVRHTVELSSKVAPDFLNFSNEKLTDFLGSETGANWLSNHQKGELQTARDRGAYYMKALRARDIDQAFEKHRLFLNYMIEHRIFMTNDL